MNASDAQLATLLAFLAPLLFALPTTCAPAGERFPYPARIAKLDGAGLRANDSYPFGEDHILTFNTPVLVVEQRNHLLRVQANDRVGYVLARDVVRAKDALRIDRYVNALEGVELRASPGGISQALLPHSSSVTCLNARSIPDPRNAEWPPETWIEVRNGALSGWVPASRLTHLPVVHFFGVTARSGLNLRSAPSLEAPILQAMPRGTIGSALMRRRDIFEVEGIPGAWLQVALGETIGWVFSGFVVITTNRENLQSALDSIEQFRSRNVTGTTIEPAEVPWQPGFADRVQSERRIGGYTIYDVLSARPDDDCTPDRPRRSIVVQQDQQGRYYHFQPEDTVVEVEFDRPLPGTVFLKQSHCSCCCPYITHTLLFLTPDAVIALSYRNRDIAGGGVCLSGPIHGIVYGQETRRSGSQIWLRLRYPTCPPEESPGGGETLSDQFVAERFVRFHFDGGALELETLGSTADLNEDDARMWANAEPVNAQTEHSSYIY